MQYPIAWAQPRENVRLLDERLRAIRGKADIAVVPEMFSTGFCIETHYMGSKLVYPGKATVAGEFTVQFDEFQDLFSK